MAERFYLTRAEEKAREEAKRQGEKLLLSILDRLEEALKENDDLKKRLRQEALREISRLGQEIEEPSEVNRLWQENKKLRQRIDQMDQTREELNRAREALRFYADKKQYSREDWGLDLPIEEDGGRRARATLSPPDGNS